MIVVNVQVSNLKVLKFLKFIVMTEFKLKSEITNKYAKLYANERR